MEERQENVDAELSLRHRTLLLNIQLKINLNQIYTVVSSLLGYFCSRRLCYNLSDCSQSPAALINNQ